MIKFPFKNRIEVSLPTSIDEITEEYLKDVATEINVAPDYSLICLVSITSLNEIAFANVKKKNGMTSVVIPVFIKCGESDSNFIKSIDIKDKLVISRSNIELSDHVRLANNKLSINDIIYYLANDDELRKNVLTNKLDFDANTKVCLLEYKIVPNNDIHGAYKDVKDIDVKFVKTL